MTPNAHGIGPDTDGGPNPYYVPEQPPQVPSEEAQKALLAAWDAAQAEWKATMPGVDWYGSIGWSGVLSKHQGLAMDAFAAQRLTAALLVIEAARDWRRREWGRASSSEIRESRRHTVDELDEDDPSMALIDALAEYDRAAAMKITDR